MDLNNRFNTTPIVSNFRNDIELINEILEHRTNFNSIILKNYFSQKTDLNNIINNKIENLPFNNINILNNYVNNYFNENNINKTNNNKDILPNFPSFFNDIKETINNNNSLNKIKNEYLQKYRDENIVNSNIYLNNQKLMNDLIMIKEPLLFNNNINNIFNSYTQLNNRILFPEYNQPVIFPSFNNNLLNNLSLSLYGGDNIQSENILVNNKIFENKRI
jgi:hypothetical protein